MLSGDLLKAVPSCELALCHQRPGAPPPFHVVSCGLSPIHEVSRGPSPIP